MKTQQSISTNQLLIFGVIITHEIFIYLISLVSFILIHHVMSIFMLILTES